jgi:serine/threonine protein kinase
MEIIANKYILREFIGKGKFGSVYKGEKKNSESFVAIKFEAKNAEIPLLKKETRILEYLARNGLRDRVPIVFWYGLHLNESICVVMSYLGETSLSNIDLSLEQLFDWFQCAISIVERIHFYGVIHRDLKPGHFMFYREKWVLIDFGFAVFVSEEDNSEKKEKKLEHIIGTPNYISVNVHNGFIPGKKDDMISLGYIFLEKYLGGILPWVNISDPDLQSLFPINHLSHPNNQIRKSMKESAGFFEQIVNIPGLLTYMTKYY